MKKNNGIVWLILAIIVIGGAYYFKDKLDLFAIAPPTGGRSDGIEQIDSTSYTCSVGGGGTGDFCDVSGVVTDTTNYPSGTPTVVFRTNSAGDYTTYGDWIAIDSDFDGDLEGYLYDAKSGAVSCGRGDEITKTPEGFSVRDYGSSTRVLVELQSGSKCTNRFFEEFSHGELSLEPKEPYTSNGQEVMGGISILYKVMWNFCPAGNPDFDYCNGNLRERSESYIWSGSTEEYRLNEGQSVTFQPTDYDGNNLDQEDFYIRSQKWDMSCAGEYPNKCSSGEFYCSNTCPEGYDFQSRGYCFTLDNSYVYTNINNVCSRGTTCFSLSTNKYNLCDGVNQNGCPVFNTEQTCPTGQDCYVDDLIREGIGSCKCDPNECSLNNRRVSELGGDYDKCVLVGNCNDWQSRTCANELVYNPSLKKCVNQPNDDGCEAYTPNKKCVGNDLYHCVNNGVVDELGNERWFWQKEQTCSLPFECIQQSDARCACSCDLNEIRCISSSTKYELCGLNCWEERDIPENMKCENDQIIPRTDIGCAYGTAGFECDTDNFEVCEQNTCVCVIDENTAQEADHNQYKCDGVELLKGIKYEGEHVSCYRWEFDKTCSEICVDGECIASYDYVGVFPKDAYAIGENIENITVDVTGNVGDNTNINVIAQLFEGTTYLDRHDTITDSTGKAIVDFDYSHPRSGTLNLNIVVGDPAGVNYEVNTDINIEKTMVITLNCPIQSNIERDISCSWTIKDAETNGLLSVIPNIEVTQGEEVISYSAVGTNQIRFRTSTTGSVFVKLTGTKADYMEATSSAIVSVNPLESDYTFSIDNLNYYSHTSAYLNTGSMIDTGIKELKFDVKESGESLPIQSVDGEIITPSGQNVGLTFTKIADGTFKTTYNFQQEGHTYHIQGIIYPTDIAKQTIPYTFTITTKAKTTSGGITGTGLDLTNYFIIGGAIMFIVIIALVLGRRKK